MVKKVEQLIVDWLKSDNENATYIAHKICALFDVSKCDGIENEAQLIAFISWYEKLSVEEIVWYDGKLLEAFKKAINCC